MIQNKSGAYDLRGLAVVVVVGAWIAGILLGYWIHLPSLVLLVAAFIMLLGLILFWHNFQVRMVLLIVSFLLLGAWRYTIASSIGDPAAISASIGAGTIEVRGRVSDEPKLEGKTRLLFIAVSSTSKNGGASWQDAHGQLEVETPGGTIEDPYGANYGDDVELKGRLQKPLPNAPPNIFASMIFPRISVSGNGGNPIIAALYHLRVVLATIIAQSLPQPEAALLVAILLGLRTPALKSLAFAFNVTGTAHLIVPSGFKVTILAGLVLASTRWFNMKRGVQTKAMLPAQKRRYNRRRWIASAAVIGSVASYTILSGGGPAALRAGIMGVLLILAPRLGRIYNVYNALAVCALLLSIIDPFVLWDVGFQLSFLGTLGIVVLTPILEKALKKLARLPFGHFIVEIASVTLAAQLATLPIMALAFKQISFIAPIVNILTVPLLGIIIFIGILVCGLGMFYAPLGLLCGWVAWPILWYIDNVVTECSVLPGAYISVNNLNVGLAWGYYGLLCVAVGTIMYKWPNQRHPHANNANAPNQLSRRTRLVLQLSAAIVVVLATGTATLAAHSNGRLTVSFLSVGPTNQQPQGEAIFIQTPDGKTALIDGGMDATSLAQELDSRLPSWHRSLDVVILSTAKSDHIVGLQDVITRYQIGEVVDAGMLHPSAGYALWRRTIAERNLHYTEVRQGMTVAVGSQVMLQVFWPRLLLHKGTNEEIDNGLIVRLITPGLRILFLGVAVMSKYALTGLISDIAPNYLQADVVQVVAQAGKDLPSELSVVLEVAKPSMILITPGALSAKQRKQAMSSVIEPLPAILAAGNTWQLEQTAQVGTIEIECSNQQWGINV
jgi:competence protein ComEC